MTRMFILQLEHHLGREATRAERRRAWAASNLLGLHPRNIPQEWYIKGYEE